MGPSQIEPLRLSSTVLHCDDFIMGCKWGLKTDPAEGRVCKKYTTQDVVYSAIKASSSAAIVFS